MRTHLLLRHTGASQHQPGAAYSAEAKEPCLRTSESLQSRTLSLEPDGPRGLLLKSRCSMSTCSRSNVALLSWCFPSTWTRTDQRAGYSSRTSSGHQLDLGVPALNRVVQRSTSSSCRSSWASRCSGVFSASRIQWDNFPRPAPNSTKQRPRPRSPKDSK